MKFLVVALSLLASPALASNACHDLWFTRNAVIDRAGYCFGSPLGRAVFNNAGCTGKSVSLPPQAQRMVAQVKEMEAPVRLPGEQQADLLGPGRSFCALSAMGPAGTG